MEAHRKSRWHDGQHRVVSRCEPGPLPIGTNLEGADEKTQALPCVCCGFAVLVSEVYHAQAARFGMMWSECDACKAIVARECGYGSRT